MRRSRQWGRETLKAVMTMTLAALLALAGYEGFVAAPYQDEAGVWTNGYGNTTGVTKNTPSVTREQAQVQLQQHVDAFGQKVLQSLTITPTQGQYDAYVSFAYNIGAPAFAKSQVVKDHNAGRFMEACRQMLRWTKLRDVQTGQLRESRGLANRRYQEYNTCLAGLPRNTNGN